MSSIIPEDIKTAEEAMKWLMKRGYGEQLAKEEVAIWEGSHEEIEDEIEDIEEEEIIDEWDDEEEDDSWDDEEDDDWDEEDDDDDEDEDVK